MGTEPLNPHQHRQVSCVLPRLATNLEPTHKTQAPGAGQYYRLDITVDHTKQTYYLQRTNKTHMVLRHTAKHSNVNHNQTFRSKLLRTIVNASYYVTNCTLQIDLNVP